MLNIFAEIINIGDELLAGHTVNGNAAWMSRALHSLGIAVSGHRVIPDRKADIVTALDGIREETRYVFVTGGLGPTGDDRTKAVITAYFGGKLVFRPELYARIEAYFRARGREPSPSNREQAEQPDNAALLPNSRGTASGMLFRRDGVSYYVLPGVPDEMKSIMQEHILPQLAKVMGGREHELQINTFGKPESELSDAILARFPRIEEEIALGFYPSLRGITLRLRGEDRKKLQDYQEGILDLLGDNAYAVTGESLAKHVVDLCRERGITLATAESCTGGLISDMITDIPGASDIFRQGYVVYSNAAKTAVLGVDPELINAHGAVSEACVKAMLQGLREVSGCDIGVAVSGIAGPSGGSPEKPVGTVWIAVGYRENVHTRRLLFDRGRRNNKEFSANLALNEVRLMLKARNAGNSKL